MQTVYRVYEGTREPHRLAVERTAEVLGRGGLALIPTETVYGVAVAVNAKIQANSHRGRAIRRLPSMAPQFLRSAPAIAVSSLSSNVSSRKPSLGWSMASKHSTAMAWISRKMPAYSRDDAGREP